MPAVSRKQQRFFGMVRQAQKEGQAKAASPEVARVASSIKKSDAKDFASTKHKGLPEKKKMNEEGYDHLRDMGKIPPTKGKKDATTMPKSYKRSPEPKKGKSALDIVKANIRKQYGKGAIMGEEKKGLWDNVHARRKAGKPKRKPGDKNYPETLNVEDVNCADRKEMAAQHKAVHNKKKDETGGMPATVTAKNRRGQMQGVDEAKVDKGRSDYGKASIRNYRRMGPGHGDPGMFDPEGKRGKTIEKRRAEHKSRRGVKGAKVPAYKVSEETALDKAKKNIGRDPDKKTCWTGYKAKGTKMKGGKSVPNCVKESNIADILARLEKKRISKGGDPEKSPLPSMKKYHADKKKKVEEGVMGMIKRAAGVKAKKTTGRDAGAIAAKIMRDKEQKKYVSFLPANEAIKYDSKGSSMDYFLGADPKKTKEYKALKKKKTQKEETILETPKGDAGKDTPTKQADRAARSYGSGYGAKYNAPARKTIHKMKRGVKKYKGEKENNDGSTKMTNFIDDRKSHFHTQGKSYDEPSRKKMKKEGTSYGLYKGSGKPSGAMKKYLDRKAKMLQKKRDSQSDAAKNNPHFDSTQPSPSGRNKYEHVSFKSYFTEGNKTARMLHKSKTSVTGNISADRGGDEKKNKESRKGLEKDLKKKGIGYTKGVGKYKYDSGETGTEVSYQTSKPAKMSKRKFGKTMRRLGRKHGQESVVTKDKNKPARLHDTESKKPGKSINIGKSKPGSNPSGQGETSGNKVRGKSLPKKQNKGAYHYG